MTWKCYSYLVGEVTVAAGEVRGAPARDGHLAQPLLGRHAEREDAENHDGIAAAEPVDEAVAAAHPRVTLTHPQRHRQTLHRTGMMCR